MKPERYVLKPSYVDAMQLNSTDDLKLVADWINSLGGDVIYGAEFNGGPADHLVINASIIARVSRRNWVLRSDSGRFNVLAPDEFESRYQKPATEQEDAQTMIDWPMRDPDSPL